MNVTSNIGCKKVNCIRIYPMTFDGVPWIVFKHINNELLLRYTYSCSKKSFLNTWY